MAEYFCGESWLSHLDLRGHGFLGGTIPVSPGDEDGRARILSEPARVHIRVFESRSNRLVAATVSAPDGSWRVEGLATDVPFRVIGVDPARQVNSAIQDWVFAEPTPAQVVVPRLEFRLPAARPGVPWRGKVLLHDAAQPWTAPVITGAPAWMSVVIYPDGLVLQGTPDAAGGAVLEVSSTVGDASVTGSGTVLVSNMVRAFRLVITANNGDATWSSLTEIRARSAANAELAVGGVASSASGVIAQAFDSDTNTRWSVSPRPSEAVPVSMQYQFATPVEMVKLLLMTADATRPNMSPRDFYVEYQLLDGNWIRAATYAGVQEWAPLTWQEFDV